MALHLSLSHQSWTSTSMDPTRGSMPTTRFPRRVEFSENFKSRSLVKRKEIMRGEIRASLETMGAQVEDIVGKVTQVNKDTFWPIVKAAGHKPVVLDM